MFKFQDPFLSLHLHASSTKSLRIRPQPLVSSVLLPETAISCLQSISKWKDFDVQLMSSESPPSTFLTQLQIQNRHWGSSQRKKLFSSKTVLHLYHTFIDSYTAFTKNRFGETAFDNVYNWNAPPFPTQKYLVHFLWEWYNTHLQNQQSLR